ncbi:MAG: amidohydrolase family protein [Thermodesulfovibrionia bacterium]
MNIDIHIHMIGNGRDIDNIDNDVYFYTDDNNHWFTRLLYNLIEDDLQRLEADLNRDGRVSTHEYIELIYRMLKESEEIDAIVLLALDGLYSPKTGLLDKERTDLLVSNRFLYRLTLQLNKRLMDEGSKKRFLFGASVSPNRRDWESELEYVLTQTDAVLVKLIPSTQHIHLMDSRHRDFYNTLSRYNIPLLCHVGPEYSFPEGIRNKRLDNFRLLERPLECGVRVIAAHCATPVFPFIDKDETREFYHLMKQTNIDGSVRLLADTSALSISTRSHLIPLILDLFPQEWLLHGSDFPIPIDGWTQLPYLNHGVNVDEYIGIVRTKNPLDRDVRIKRAHGFSDLILSNAERVLRLKV